jgi:uncharacterized protein YjbI with pentapeptide repeats
MSQSHSDAVPLHPTTQAHDRSTKAEVSPPEPPSMTLEAFRQILYAKILNEGVEAFNAYRQQTNYQPLDLTGLDFSEKDLTGINFSSCTLNGCNFDQAYLAESKFILANCPYASFRETDCYQASFEEADLTCCNFIQANCQHVNFSEATLDGCELNQADFTDAVLMNASLKDAVLNDTLFERSDLSGCNLTGSIDDWVIYTEVTANEHTRWGNVKPV